MLFMLCTPVIGEQGFMQEEVLIVELLTLAKVWKHPVGGFVKRETGFRDYTSLKHCFCLFFSMQWIFRITFVCLLVYFAIFIHFYLLCFHTIYSHHVLSPPPTSPRSSLLITLSLSLSLTKIEKKKNKPTKK